MNVSSPAPRRAALWLRRLVRLAVLIPAAAAAFAQSAGDAVLNGRIFDASTRAALGGAEVAVRGPVTATATTERDGSFSLRGLPPGNYTVVVRYLGLAEKSVAVAVAAGRAADVSVSLGDEVVQLGAFKVSGMLDGQARALNQQKNAAGIVNIVASDAFGEFPDASIADATRRLPGVTIEREAGNPEGRYVTIRGLNAEFNAVSIDGQRVTVSNFDGASRSVPLDVVSAKSADAIEVTKSLTPDRDGDGIGGAVNIRTRNAFDRNGRSASAEAAYSLSELVRSYRNNPFSEGYKVSASFSDFIGAEKKWGYLLSADYRHTPYATTQAGTSGWWDPERRDPIDGSFPDRVTFNGQGYFIPRAFILQEFFDDVKGGGVTLNLEHRPGNDAKYKLNASYSLRDTNRGRQRQLIDYRFGSTRIDTSATAALPVRVDGDTFTQFVTTNSSRLERQVRDFYEDQTVLNLAFKGENRLGDNTLTYALGYNRGEFDGSAAKDTNATFRWGDNLGEFRSSRNGYSIAPGNAYETRLTASNNRFDPANYVFSSLDRGTRNVADHEFAVSGDYKLAARLGDSTDGAFKVGAKARLRGRELKDRQNFFTGLVGNARWYGNRATDASGAQIFGSLVAPWSVAATADGRYDFGYFMDPAAVRAAADTLQARGLLAAATDNAARSLVNSYDADENVYSAYALVQGTWGKLSAVAGARLEYTETEFNTHAGTSAGGNIVNPRPIRGSNDYTDVLPNVNVRLDPVRNLVIRAALTGTLARASYTQLNPTSTLNERPDDLSIPTLTVGNSKLKPVRSLNYDLTAEYYFSSLGLVSGGVFFKDMKNNIYRLNDLTTVAPYGTVQRRQWTNADGADVKGFEVAFERQLRFLPAPFDGFGVAANYTKVDSKVRTGRPERAGRDTPLFAQVPDTWNASLTYSKFGFQTRVAYNWRSAYLLFNGLDANPKLDRYLDDHGELDVTASYKINEHFTVFAELINLTNSAERAYNGDATRRLDYIEYRDWSANFGVRWRL
jgi:TonB-dependent receptor